MVRVELVTMVTKKMARNLRRDVIFVLFSTQNMTS